jgi:hypothetical protein
MDQAIHLGFVGIFRLGHAIELQRLRRRTAALVEGRDEAFARPHLVGLFLL